MDLYLSPREKEIFDLKRQGLYASEIGERLFITARTVNFHLQQMYLRFGVSRFCALERIVEAKNPPVWKRNKHDKIEHEPLHRSALTDCRVERSQLMLRPIGMGKSHPG